MVFSSVTFLFYYLPLLLGIYFLAPVRWRNMILLLSSLGFYFWGAGKLFYVIFVSIVLDYFLGLIQGALKQEWSRRICIWFSVFANLGILFYFKYSNFFIGEVNGIITSLGFQPLPALSVLLPIGLSFYTFESLSYQIDVYRGEVEAQRSFIKYALFVSLFPHLIAGPIVRYKDIADRIEARTVSQADWVYGIGRFITGLGKKVIIADGLSPTADLVFQSDVGALHGSAAWVGLIAFFFQIYFDFSGYSDMAIGLSRLFGFKLRENFNYPYTSRSITAFWQRWHMTLTGWFRDYLYRPLSSRGQGSIRRAVNTYIVFVLCGLWHGASWTFITFGVYFGTILVAEHFYWARFGAKLPKVLQHLYVLAVIAGGMVFFRSPSMSFASDFMLRLVGIESDGAMLSARQYLDPEVLTLFFIGAICCTPLPMRIFTDMKKRLESAHSHSRLLSSSRWAFESFACGAGVLLFVLCACLAVSRSYTPFIYFQF